MGSNWRPRTSPSQRELEILLASFAYYRDGFQTDAASATRYLAQGEAPRDTTLDARELAAYTAVASIILNLDATLTKD